MEQRAPLVDDIQVGLAPGQLQEHLDDARVAEPVHAWHRRVVLALAVEYNGAKGGAGLRQVAHQLGLAAGPLVGRPVLGVVQDVALAAPLEDVSGVVAVPSLG